ncbi:MAG: hypothetical protein IAE90_00555 [Ignavibacteria bacterium]|nr:hypothetical protein [Ignavibacteria bacterium]
MKKSIFVILFLAVFGTVVFSQTTLDPGNLYVEFRSETMGGFVDTIKLYKQDQKIKLYRTGKYGSFMTLLDFSLNHQVDIAIDKGKLASRYTSINYATVRGVWHIYYNGFTGDPNIYKKLPAKQVICGKECDVYESVKKNADGSVIQYFMFGKMMLKSFMPGNTTEAVVADENPVFAEGEFDIPADVSWLYDQAR